MSVQSYLLLGRNISGWLKLPLQMNIACLPQCNFDVPESWPSTHCCGIVHSPLYLSPCIWTLTHFIGNLLNACCDALSSCHRFSSLVPSWIILVCSSLLVSSVVASWTTIYRWSSSTKQARYAASVRWTRQQFSLLRTEPRFRTSFQCSNMLCHLQVRRGFLPFQQHVALLPNCYPQSSAGNSNCPLRRCNDLRPCLFQQARSWSTAPRFGCWIDVSFKGFFPHDNGSLHNLLRLHLMSKCESNGVSILIYV